MFYQHIKSAHTHTHAHTYIYIYIHTVLYIYTYINTYNIITLIIDLLIIHHEHTHNIDSHSPVIHKLAINTNSLIH